MVPLTSLVLPAVLSGVVVFILSSLIHMVIGYHRSDFKPVPNEDGVLDAMRKFNIPPGDYMMPRPANMAAMKDPAFVEKMKKGPMLFTMLPAGQTGMGSQLIQWFLFSVLVSFCAAYITGRALGPGAGYRDVFRFAGCTAFLCYSMAYIPTSIWYRKSWGTTFRNMLDGLIYGLFTGGMFGWLWPKM